MSDSRNDLPGSDAPQASPFETIRHEDASGVYWSARELAKLLGYRR
ncbi:MAG TPA: hypothetical protein VF812_01670 [Ktedonobacterales bacterium]